MARFIDTTDMDASAMQRPAPSQSRQSRDNRAEPRYRVHLRSGEIADQNHRFICNCVIRDRSVRGARLLLPKNVSTPDEIWFHDHERKAPVKAQVRWRMNREIGIYIPLLPGLRK